MSKRSDQIKDINEILPEQYHIERAHKTAAEMKADIEHLKAVALKRAKEAKDGR